MQDILTNWRYTQPLVFFHQKASVETIKLILTNYIKNFINVLKCGSFEKFKRKSIVNWQLQTQWIV